MPPFPWNKILDRLGADGHEEREFRLPRIARRLGGGFLLSVPEADRTGLFKMIAATPKDAGPPPFVPADAVKFWRWRVDGQKGWAALQKMVDNISPAALSSLNAAIAMANASARKKIRALTSAKISSAIWATISSAIKKRRREIPSRT